MHGVKRSARQVGPFDYKEKSEIDEYEEEHFEGAVEMNTSDVVNEEDSDGEKLNLKKQYKNIIENDKRGDWQIDLLKSIPIDSLIRVAALNSIP